MRKDRGSSHAVVGLEIKTALACSSWSGQAHPSSSISKRRRSHLAALRVIRFQCLGAQPSKPDARSAASFKRHRNSSTSQSGNWNSWL